MNVVKNLKQAEKLVSYGKINDALELYQEVLSEQPRNTAVHSLVADLYVGNRQYAQASRHLTKLAEIYGAQGEPIEAIACYRRILSFLPQNVPVRERLLELYRKVNSKSDIISLLQELCSIYELENNLPKIIDCLEQLSTLEPANPGYAWKLAALLKQSNRKEEAVALYAQISRRAAEQSSWEEARKALEEISVLEPGDTHITLQIAKLYDAQGLVQKAIEMILPLLKQGQAQAEHKAYLAQLCSRAGKLDEAERLYEDLLKRGGLRAEDLILFIEILIARKKDPRALQTIDKYFRNTQDAGLRQKAIACLEKILKADPFKVETYELLERFLTVSYQYERLARVLGAHANLCIQNRDFDKALDLLRHCVELEPYNREFRSQLHDVESLKGGAVVPSRAAPDVLPRAAQEDDASSGSDASSTAQEISLVSDDDVDNFIVDIELLEKFGQHKNAIVRLEKALKQYPQEIKLRQKLKTVYLDRQLAKKAAQECLEIAKILQLQDQKEEATRYIREAQRLNPLLSSSRKTAVAPASPEKPVPDASHGALRGDLSEIGLLDIIQLLDNAQKSGRLQLNSEGNPGTIFFNSGKIVDASYLGKKGEEAIYALVGSNGGYFDYQPSSEPFGVVIQESNTNLLLEGLRRLDEANRDLSEAESEEAAEPAPAPPLKLSGANPLKANLGPDPPPAPRRPLLNESSPLENI